MLLVIGHLSFVICHLSFVICHLSFVIGHLSLVICPLSLVTALPVVMHDSPQARCLFHKKLMIYSIIDKDSEKW
ncbi:MAG: hypothetical protein F6K31_11605 [Symploca sp. SIO2G7]|nr:hypothetical protein [Symploca sp. SIO2G7]